MSESSVLRDHFWEHYPLSALSGAEWEALCDGCGRCCLHKLEYEDCGEIDYTDVACKMLDTDTAKCRDYPGRKTHVPDCVQLTPENVGAINWLPPTCAYRRLHEGRDLPRWHPLLSGDPARVQRARISVIGRVLSETEVNEEDIEEHVIHWVKMR